MEVEAKEELFERDYPLDNLIGKAKDAIVNGSSIIRRLGEPRYIPEKKDVEIIDSGAVACLYTLWGGFSLLEISTPRSTTTVSSLSAPVPPKFS